MKTMARTGAVRTRMYYNARMSNLVNDTFLCVCVFEENNRRG
jgi:hypothetical protein